MKQRLLLITLVAGTVLIACSKKSNPGKTAEAKPKPTVYTSDVLPLIQMKCAPCHLPSKGGNKANFETYATAQKFGADIIARIEKNPGERGFMPFRGTAKLSPDEIGVFKKWVADGMLEK